MSHSGRRPPHDRNLDNTGLGWLLRWLGITAPLGAQPRPTIGDPPGAAPESFRETFSRRSTRRSPWPLTHLKRPASSAPCVEYPKYTGANTKTGRFTKLASPLLRVTVVQAPRPPPPLLP
ncbi:hypothetical protein HPB50_014758 [Hyalomma asiaticum]|uniref:Uncharacterized protein n=1 Tax=Hyalomma asiaticum TaxID=266040 RepID=A0ACB7TIC9_HYAAI|nr:hypothetical protein HPB50_014758 [Hyalomma asiaticum]